MRRVVFVAARGIVAPKQESKRRAKRRNMSMKTQMVYILVVVCHLWWKYSLQNY